MYNGFIHLGFYGSEAFIHEWLFPYLQQNYGRDYMEVQPAIVVMDTMMEFNTSEYSQAKPPGLDALVCSTFNP